jgi:hypothetical protein
VFYQAEQIPVKNLCQTIPYFRFRVHPNVQCVQQELSFRNIRRSPTESMHLKWKQALNFARFLDVCILWYVNFVAESRAIQYSTYCFKIWLYKCPVEKGQNTTALRVFIVLRCHKNSDPLDQIIVWMVESLRCVLSKLYRKSRFLHFILNAKGSLDSLYENYTNL